MEGGRPSIIQGEGNRDFNEIHISNALRYFAEHPMQPRPDWLIDALRQSVNSDAAAESEEFAAINSFPVLQNP